MHSSIFPEDCDLTPCPRPSRIVSAIPARVGVPDRVSGSLDAVVDPGFAAAVGAVASTLAANAGSRLSGDRPIKETVQRVRQWVDSLL